MDYEQWQGQMSRSAEPSMQDDCKIHVPDDPQFDRETNDWIQRMSCKGMATATDIARVEHEAFAATATAWASVTAAALFSAFLAATLHKRASYYNSVNESRTAEYIRLLGYVLAILTFAGSVTAIKYSGLFD